MAAVNSINMAKVKYTVNQPFKEFYKKNNEPERQLLKYLECTLATVRLTKPLPKTMKNAMSYVDEIVFRGSHPNNIVPSLDDMLRTFDIYVQQLQRYDGNTLEDILTKINALSYNCRTRAKLYDKNSLFYKAGFNANWEYKGKEGALSLEQLELLCGREMGDLINYNIAIRKEFWEIAAKHLEYLHNKYLSIKDSVTLAKISNKIPVPLAVELTHLFKEKGYINNDLSFAQFETAICTLLSIDKEAYKKSKSAFKCKTHNKYRNLEKIVEELL